MPLRALLDDSAFCASRAINYIRLRGCTKCGLGAQSRSPRLLMALSTSAAASYPRIRRGAKQAPTMQPSGIYDDNFGTEEEEPDVVTPYPPVRRRSFEIEDQELHESAQMQKSKPWEEAMEARPKFQKDRVSKAVQLEEQQPQPETFSPTKTPTAYTWDVPPVTVAQLSYANELFKKYPPRFHRSAAEFSLMKETGMPEVAFLGRSNVGKSSLLNAVMNAKDLARTSANPGHTRLMNSFSIGNGRISLIDMPGYGFHSRPEWGKEIMNYLRRRKQLRRTFVLIDASHGIKGTDEMILDVLSRGAIPYQIILSKMDRVQLSDESPGGKVEGTKPKNHKRGSSTLYDQFDYIREYMESLHGVAGFGEILATCVKVKQGQPERGIGNVRWAILRATGLSGEI